MIDEMEMDTNTSKFDSDQSQSESDNSSMSLKLNNLVPTFNVSVAMEDLPEEILEQIISFLSPYKDLDAAKLVSKQWLRLVHCMVHRRLRHFSQALSQGSVNWTHVVREPVTHERTSGGSISDRFSHSAAFHDGCMYVFGGCTATSTTFNDLWKLDLTTRQWIRPVAMGAYPSPKACATMVVYKENLVLYGGWSHPIPYPLHQSAHYFSELHFYNTSTNRWSNILSLDQEPEALGGHSASVAGHLMVVFGGSPRPGLGTNNLWVYNFEKNSWKLQATCRHLPQPEPRYGQFQTTLDDHTILIMGGCISQHGVFNDVWLLTLTSDGPWEWTKLSVVHPELAAPHTWCHGAAKVGDKLVVIAKSNKARETKNRKPEIHNTALVPEDLSDLSSLQSSSVQTSPQQSCASMHQHQFEPQDSSAREAMMASGSGSPETMDSDTCGACAPADSRASLIALQKKLHRHCTNLADPTHHQHSGQQAEPEGHFLRLQNRWANNEDVSLHNSTRPPAPQFRSREQGRDYLGTIRARGDNDHAMPSIRPNAMCNRQKQLEALQRQEEMLLSKSRALAAAKKKLADSKSGSVDSMEDPTPDVIPTKNRMDVFVADISRVHSKGVLEWLPLSELQAPCAPTETICCSLVQGRGELILFGGVIREAATPIACNTAINKLYVLHA